MPRPKPVANRWNRNTYTTELEEWAKELETMLRNCRGHLEICINRLKAYNLEPWCQEIDDLLDDPSQYAVELVCSECREINYAPDLEKAKTKPCDDCGKVGTLVTFAEDDKAAAAEAAAEAAKKKPEITQREWQSILLALRAKLKSPTVKGGDREARTWRKDLRDVIRSVKQKEYDEINDADWTEIYYALDSVDNGGAALTEKIGPDGKRMWTGPGVDRG